MGLGKPINFGYKEFDTKFKWSIYCIYNCSTKENSGGLFGFVVFLSLNSMRSTTIRKGHSKPRGKKTE